MRGLWFRSRSPCAFLSSLLRCLFADQGGVSRYAAGNSPVARGDEVGRARADFPIERVCVAAAEGTPSRGMAGHKTNPSIAALRKLEASLDAHWRDACACPINSATTPQQPPQSTAQQAPAPPAPRSLATPQAVAQPVAPRSRATPQASVQSASPRSATPQARPQPAPAQPAVTAAPPSVSAPVPAASHPVDAHPRRGPLRRLRRGRGCCASC